MKKNILSILGCLSLFCIGIIVGAGLWHQHIKNQAKEMHAEKQTELTKNMALFKECSSLVNKKWNELKTLSLGVEQQKKLSCSKKLEGYRDENSFTSYLQHLTDTLDVELETELVLSHIQLQSCSKQVIVLDELIEEFTKTDSVPVYEDPKTILKNASQFLKKRWYAKN